MAVTTEQGSSMSEASEARVRHVGGIDATALDDLCGLRVLVVGDLMLDRYVTGSVARISPEAPVPVLRPSGESCVVGGAGNVAVNLVGLGAQVDCAGWVGADAAGDTVRQLLTRAGVRLEVLRLASKIIVVKSRKEKRKIEA